MKSENDPNEPDKIFRTNLGNIEILKSLGKGKSGYSYLAEKGGRQYVLKLMHYELCPYYDFQNQNKVGLEVNAYNVLSEIGISIPELYDYSKNQNYLLKEYVPGNTATELIAENKISNEILKQLFEMFKLLRKADINIDYFPSNFVISDSRLYYIDYEFNKYLSEWDLINWGIYYWVNNEGVKKFIETSDASYINEDLDKGIPFKQPFEKKVRSWRKRFSVS